MKAAILQELLLYNMSLSVILPMTLVGAHMIIKQVKIINWVEHSEL